MATRFVCCSLLLLALVSMAMAAGDEKFCCHVNGDPQREFWYVYTPSDVTLECHRAILSQAQNSSPELTGFAHESNGCHQLVTSCTQQFGNGAGDPAWCFQDSDDFLDLFDDDEDDDNGLGANAFIRNFSDAIDNSLCGNSFAVTRTWTSLSSCRGVGTISNTQSIVVTDSTPPELKVPDDLTVECENSLSVVLATNDERFGQAFATDLCREPTLTESVTTSGDSCTQILTRTFSASDGCATTTRTQTVRIVDTTPPIMEHPPNLVAECDNIPGPVAIDANDGCQDVFLPAAVAAPDIIHPGRCSSEYSIERVYSVSDACGNAAEHKQIIVVEDTTPPVVTPNPQSIKLQLTCGAFLPAPTIYIAIDACSGAASLSFVEDTTESTDGALFNVVRSYVAADDCGNSVAWEEVYTADQNDLIRLTATPTATISFGGSITVTVEVSPAAACPVTGGYLVISHGQLSLLLGGSSALCVNRGAGVTVCPLTDLLTINTFDFLLEVATPPLTTIVISYSVAPAPGAAEQAVITGGPTQTIVTVL